ncbi:hypothetical protein J7E63_27405 [Bacillus sp. ISL-75]|nr:MULTISPECIES: hypothetical protein [unclassified Bacillus (in: firmicutes)]MBT2730555.1 hypothetical protein [Bacillus sp. ISL-75]MBT2740798.1 hypothetical protein [Bacillus sp. ISL-77]
MVRLYDEYLSGKTVDYIKRIFELEGIKKLERKGKMASNNPPKYAPQ